MATRIESDVIVVGHFAASTMTLPDASVSNAAVKADAEIVSEKLEHQHVLTYNQVIGTAAVSATSPMFTVRSATGCELYAVEAVCHRAPTGGDKGINCDVLIGNATATTPATALSGLLSFANGDTDYEIKTATIATSALDDGDVIFAGVQAFGSTGTQAQGVNLTVAVRESAD